MVHHVAQVDHAVLLLVQVDRVTVLIHQAVVAILAPIRQVVAVTHVRIRQAVVAAVHVQALHAAAAHALQVQVVVLQEEETISNCKRLRHKI